MTWAWPIMGFLTNAFAVNFLQRNQDLTELFVAKEQEWQINVILSAAENLGPFLLICNFLLSSEIKDKCKNSLLLNVLLTYICLSVPAVFAHVSEYPEFHINIKDVKQHNSRIIRNLITACSFAISSWCLSKTYDIPFEAGFFSACLGYAMKFSSEIVDKSGKNRKPIYISCTFIFCFLLILLRKYLEENESTATEGQRSNQSPIGSDTAGQSPDSTSNTNYLQASQGIINGPMGGSALNVYTNSKPNEPTLRVWERTSEISKPCSDVGTIASDDCIRTIEGSEDPGQKIGHEDMRSSTSSGDMEITGSFGFEGYEKDDVPLLLPKTDNIIDGEIQIVNIGIGQMERSIAQRQDCEKDDTPRLTKSNMKVNEDSTHLPISKPTDDDDDDDNDSNHESSDDEGSDGDGFHSGMGGKVEVGRRDKDPGQESDCQEQRKMKPLRADILEIASSSNLGGDIPLLLSESKNMEVDPGQTGGSVDPRDGIDYEKHGEMKIDSMLRNLTAALSGKKFFCSGSRNYKKDAVTVTPIPEKMRMIFNYYFPALMLCFWSLFMLFIASCLTTGREFLIKKEVSWFFLFVLTTSCSLLIEFVNYQPRDASMANWEMEVTEQSFVVLTYQAHLVHIDILNYQPRDASMANWEMEVTEQSFGVEEKHKHPEIIAPISDMETSSLPKKEHIQGID